MRHAVAIATRFPGNMVAARFPFLRYFQRVLTRCAASTVFSVLRVGGGTLVAPFICGSALGSTVQIFDAGVTTASFFNGRIRSTVRRHSSQAFLRNVRRRSFTIVRSIG